MRWPLRRSSVGKASDAATLLTRSALWLERLANVVELAQGNDKEAQHMRTAAIDLRRMHQRQQIEARMKK